MQFLISFIGAYIIYLIGKAIAKSINKQRLKKYTDGYFINAMNKLKSTNGNNSYKTMVLFGALVRYKTKVFEEWLSVMQLYFPELIGKTRSDSLINSLWWDAINLKKKGLANITHEGQSFTIYKAELSELRRQEIFRAS